jgi:hypothetical protein
LLLNIWPFGPWLGLALLAGFLVGLGKEAPKKMVPGWLGANLVVCSTSLLVSLRYASLYSSLRSRVIVLFGRFAPLRSIIATLKCHCASTSSRCLDIRYAHYLCLRTSCCAYINVLARRFAPIELFLVRYAHL